MKVVQLTASISNRGGGIYNIVQDLSHALRAGGVDVRAMGLLDERTHEDSAAWDGVPAEAHATVGPSAFGFAPDLVPALSSGAPDLVHLHGLWMYPSVAVMRWARRSDQPFVVTTHGMLDPWALRNAQWKKRIAAALYERRMLRGAACLQVNSIAELNAVRDFGLRAPVAVIPNGVELPGNAAREAPALAEPLWRGRVPADAKVLLFLGRIHPKKGLSELLDAFAAIRRAEAAAPWHLAIVGWDDGDHEASLRRQADDLGLNDRVHWLGPRFGAEKAAALDHADAFVLPSYSEGLPMAVLEAWAHGLPVVMTAACNIPEGFEAGAAFETHTEVERLAESLRAFFRLDEHERAAMGRRGRGLVEARFTWPQVAAQMRALYAWVLGEGGRPDFVEV